MDIVDEAISLFKANVLFRKYEVKGPADRVIIYLTLYISKCLNAIRDSHNKSAAEAALYQLAIANFSIPGERNFVLAGFVVAPASRGEADQARQYLQQLRQETGQRLCAALYQHDEMKPSKWWMCFKKRKFLNKEL